MTRYDRYCFGQLMRAFGFFALALALVYWINQAVILFDRLIADGQSFLTVMEFTILSLPTVVRVAIPVAAFAAAAQMTARMRSESEIVSIQAAGAGAFRIARPVLVFGLAAAALLALLVHILVPLSRDRLEARTDQIERDATARLLTVGTFLHPADGVTFYSRARAADGALLDVFLTDARDPARRTDYSAPRAFLLRGPAAEGGNVQLVMYDGLSQSLAPSVTGPPRLFVTRFEEFGYDLGPLGGGGMAGETPMRDRTTADLLAADLPPHAAAREVARRGAESAITVAAALIGFAVVVAGGFSRKGAWPQVTAGVVLLLLLEGSGSAVEDAVSREPGLWAIQFLPAAVGLVISALLLRWAERPRRVRDAGPEAPA